MTDLDLDGHRRLYSYAEIEDAYVRGQEDLKKVLIDLIDKRLNILNDAVFGVDYWNLRNEMIYDEVDHEWGFPREPLVKLIKEQC